VKHVYAIAHFSGEALLPRLEVYLIPVGDALATEAGLREGYCNYVD